MTIREIVRSEKCIPVFNDVQIFVTNCLRDYVSTVRKQIEEFKFPFTSKDIFDLVWGSVEFTPEEVFIMDSPLLQRLRGIKQLGLASMVYCNADYSRFVHTLGVTEIAGRMAKVLTSDTRLLKSEAFNFIQIVRVAALFHDTGHMFFSHVSEQYFTKNTKSIYFEMINESLKHFRTETSTPRAKLHEMLSVMIVNTAEVGEVIELIRSSLYQGMANRNITNRIIEYISSLIIGTPCDALILPYSSIINGPIDADKIDYLSRDSASTKVPIAVDVSRLIQKLTIVNLDESKFTPPDIWNDSYENRLYQGMAIRYSARKTSWQLHMARSIMYESVYFHHKKLSAETMFRYGLEIFERHVYDTDFGKYHALLSYRDDFFNEYTFGMIKGEQSERLASLFQKIRNRDLMKRVAAISLDTMHSKDETKSRIYYDNFEKEIIINKYSKEQNEFFEKLDSEILKVAGSLGRTIDLDNALFSFIESFPTEDEQGQMDMILVELGNGEYKKASDFFKSETWSQGKDNKQQEYFLITNMRDRDLVYIALEKVLYTYDEKYVLSLEAINCAKYTKSDIFDLKHKLWQKGYYNDSAELISDELLWFLIDKKKFDSVLDRYKSFQGKYGRCVDRASLFAYLRQFLYYTKEERLLRSIFDGVLRILENMTYINRASFQTIAESLFCKVANHFPEGKYRKCMIRLGGERDSAASWSYYTNDISGKGQYNYMTIETALELDPSNSVLVFFDDGAYSGSQVISIFQELMGVPLDQRATGETHTHELDENQKEKLKKANIVLAYLCFNEASQSHILDHLRALGIEKARIIYENNLNKKIFDDRGEMFTDKSQMQLMKDVFSQIGEALALTKAMPDGENFKPRWDADRAKKSALGYNDAQQIIVFERNIPTYSLTALWLDGKYKSADWRGLFQRTDKD